MAAPVIYTSAMKENVWKPFSASFYNVGLVIMNLQVIPLHLPPGDTSIERTLQIDGTSEQIETAKQLVNEVISEVCFLCLICCEFWTSSSFFMIIEEKKDTCGRLFKLSYPVVLSS